LVYGAVFLSPLPSVAVITAVYKCIPPLAPGFIAIFIYARFVKEETVATGSAFWNILRKRWSVVVWEITL
jgi:hypothetical protein